MVSKNQSLLRANGVGTYMYPVLPFVKGFDPFRLYKIMLFILSGFTMSHILFEWGKEFQRTLFRKSFLTALKIRWLLDSRTKMFFRPASSYSIILDFLFLLFHLWNFLIMFYMHRISIMWRDRYSQLFYNFEEIFHLTCPN